MSEALVPLAYQLGVGGISGFFVGYAVKRITRIAILIGVFAFSLIYFAYTNVININIDELIRITGQAGPALGLLAPLVSTLPSLMSFFLGLAFGLKKG